MGAWEQLYEAYGITDFMNYISSPELQAPLLGVKIVFILFAGFFLCAVIWFYFNSTYLQYQFLQDMEEFFNWQPYGLKSITKRWNRIAKKLESGLEADYKLAVIEADDFLYQTLEERGYQGETFEELVVNAGRRMLTTSDEILEAHNIRNSIIYTPEYKLSAEQAKGILSIYENAIKNIAAA